MGHPNISLLKWKGQAKKGRLATPSKMIYGSMQGKTIRKFFFVESTQTMMLLRTPGHPLHQWRYLMREGRKTKWIKGLLGPSSSNRHKKCEIFCTMLDWNGVTTFFYLKEKFWISALKPHPKFDAYFPTQCLLLFVRFINEWSWRSLTLPFH